MRPMKLTEGLFGVLAATMLLARAAGAVPAAVTVQGRLTDSEGLGRNGAFAVRFSVYGAETGGTALWTKTVSSLPVRGGTFQLLLAETPGQPRLADVFSGGAAFLELQVLSGPGVLSPEESMTPRQPLVSVPYAIKAGSVGGPGLGNGLKSNVRVEPDPFAHADRVRVTADILSVQGVALSGLDVTADMRQTGAGGLMDGASDSPDAWYAVLVITDDAGSRSAGLLAPAASYQAPTLPPGYTKFRRTGWVRNNSAAAFVRSYQRGDRWEYGDATAAVLLQTAQPATTRTRLPVSPFVPPTCRLFELFSRISVYSGTEFSVWAQVAGGHRTLDAGDPVSTLFLANGLGGTAVSEVDVRTIPLDASQTIEYRVSPTMSDSFASQIIFAVLAYYDEI